MLATDDDDDDDDTVEHKNVPQKNRVRFRVGPRGLHPEPHFGNLQTNPTSAGN